jgi:hypothetical protein
VFTNRGGRLAHWILKDYRDSVGRPVDLVPQKHSRRPAAAVFAEGGRGRADPAAQLRAVSRDTGRGHRFVSRGVVFEFQDASGLDVRKEFHLDPQSYRGDVYHVGSPAEQSFSPYVQWGPGLGDLASTSGGSFFAPSTSPPPEAIVHNGKDVRPARLNKVASGTVQEGTLRFAGVDDHYFIAAPSTLDRHASSTAA